MLAGNSGGTGALRGRLWIVALAAGMMTVAGCKSTDRVEAPPRATDRAPSPGEVSQISVPVDINASALRAAVDRAVPRTLWTINKVEPQCIKPQRTRIFGRNVRLTPPIRCTIVGQVNRGAVTLRGQGQDILVDLPINAQISARDVGGILHGETATGSAMAHARIRIDLDANWKPRGTVQLSYGWTTPPGIDFLGQRITFTEQADEKLRPIVRELETTVERELARMNIRQQAEVVWRRAFTSVQLNEQNPPVWMRITPQKLGYGGYTVSGNNLRLNLGIEALTETFVGDRPANPAATALPALHRIQGQSNRLSFFIPVVADYTQLEPVLQRALQRRSERPFDVPGIGPVDAKFERVTGYGTTNNRLAVGLTVTATPRNSSIGPTHGILWITALPVNQAGSAEISFQNLEITGQTDGVGGDLLIKFGNSPGVAEVIASALTQNFTQDLTNLEGKIRRAVDNTQQGDFVIQTRINDFQTGEIKAYGNGLYLPVRVTGTASVLFRPVS
jgi:hypothetical protein